MAKWAAPPGGTAPRAPEEEALAAVWRQVLRLDRVGVEEDFFSVGGDSILAIQIVSRAAQAGLHFTVRNLFEHPTIAGLAGVARRERAADDAEGEVAGPIPLTPI